MSLNNEVAGIRGRRPEGCVVRIGKKGLRGFPVDRHRFYIATTTQNSDGVRPNHPSFSMFNNLQGDTKSHPASSLTMQLVHASRSDCFESRLRAQVDPRRNKSVPGMRPWCSGDGHRAERWNFDTNSYEPIECPNDHCAFRQPDSGPRKKGKGCKVQARLWARLVWSDGDYLITKPDGTEQVKSVQSPLPTMYARFSSNSWNTAANLQGYFDYWDSIAVDLTKLGADLVDYVENYDDEGNLQRLVTARRYSLMGARFRLTLQEKSDTDMRTGAPRKYPVVTISPIDDPWEHLRMQTQRMASLRIEAQEARAMLTDRDLSTDEERTQDFLSNEVGGHTEGVNE
ncbi:MAG: hypothetical protein ACPG4T_03350 [Nannocystaceae bacterium]